MTSACTYTAFGELRCPEGFDDAPAADMVTLYVCTRGSPARGDYGIGGSALVGTTMGLRTRYGWPSTIPLTEVQEGGENCARRLKGGNELVSFEGVYLHTQTTMFGTIQFKRSQLDQVKRLGILTSQSPYCLGAYVPDLSTRGDRRALEMRLIDIMKGQWGYKTGSVYRVVYPGGKSYHLPTTQGFCTKDGGMNDAIIVLMLGSTSSQMHRLRGVYDPRRSLLMCEVSFGKWLQPGLSAAPTIAGPDGFSCEWACQRPNNNPKSKARDVCGWKCKDGTTYTA